MTISTTSSADPPHVTRLDAATASCHSACRIACSRRSSASIAATAARIRSIAACPASERTMRQRAGGVAGPIEGNGAVELARASAPLPAPARRGGSACDRAGRQHAAQRPASARGSVALGAGVRREIALLAGEQEAALARLGVAHARSSPTFNCSRMASDWRRRAAAILTGLERPIGEERDQRDGDGGQQQAGECPAGKRASGEEGGGQWHAGMRRSIPAILVPAIDRADSETWRDARRAGAQRCRRPPVE